MGTLKSRSGLEIASLVARCLFGMASVLAISSACQRTPTSPVHLAPTEPPLGGVDSLATPDLDPPADFSVRYLLSFHDVSGTERVVRFCSGALSVETQEGIRFDGRFNVAEDDGCSPADSGRIHGTLRPLGEIDLELEVEGAPPNELQGSIGCTYQIPASRFTGAMNRKKFVVQSTANVLCSSPNAGPTTFDLRVRIDAVRLGNDAQ